MGKDVNSTQRWLIGEAARWDDVTVEDIARVLNGPLVQSICEFTAVDYPTFSRVMQATAEMIMNPEVDKGVRVEALKDAAQVSHIRDFMRGGWEDCCEFVARAVSRPASSGDFECELIGVRIAQSGRANNWIGRDPTKNAGNDIRVIGTSIGRADRHIQTFEMPLTTGTRHDYSSDLADAKEIAKISETLKTTMLGPLEEHLAYLLLQRRQRRETMARAIATHPEWGIEIGQLFGSLTLVRPLQWGKATKRSIKWTDTAYPGTQEELVDVFEKAGEPAVLTCRVSRGENVDYKRQGFVKQRTLAYRVEYWHHAERQMLVRKAIPRSGRGVNRRHWRLIGVDEQAVEDAIVAIEHSLNETEACLERHERDCRPWRTSARLYERPLVAAIDAADAACVEAERRIRSASNTGDVA